jgi:hypothetical protein
MKRIFSQNQILKTKAKIEENENLFRLSSIPPGCKNYFDLDALKYWLLANLKAPNLAFPYGDSLITPYKRSQYLKHVWCTFHYSQNLHPKQWEKYLAIWKNVLIKLCDQNQSRKEYPSLLIPCPNMGPTSFTWFHDLHRVMDDSLNKEGFALWTFNPAATRLKHFKKPKLQEPFPPVPFFILKILIKQDLKHFKEQQNMAISYQQNIVLHLK